MGNRAEGALADRLERQLGLVEEGLRDAVLSKNPFVTEAARHLIEAGGKRFRPAMVLTCAEFGTGYDEKDLIDAALVVELTHVASLYHDDVMDEAKLRRAVPSANVRYGNSVSILIGDFVFAKASSLVAGLGPDYVRLQAECFAELVTGQIAETVGPAEGTDPIDHHHEVLAGKTGSLIRTSAVFGAMIAGADQKIVDALAEYASAVGLVFQLSDDLIDITSDVTGKTPGTDLREGIPTLPTLLLAASEDPTDMALFERIQGDLSDDAVLADVLGQLRQNHVIDDARARIEKIADQARGAIKDLPEGEAKDGLLQLCDEVVTRSA